MTETGLDTPNRDKVSEYIKKLFEKQEFEKISETLHKLKIESKELYGILETVLALELVDIDDEDDVSLVSDTLITSVLPMVTKRCQLFKLKKPLSFSDVKILSNRIFERTFEPGISDSGKLSFFITPHKTIKGKISTAFFPKEKKVFTLATAYVSAKGTQLVFFGQPKKQTEPHLQLKKDFYVYQFHSDNHKKYVLLSDSEHIPQHCVVKGLVVNRTDLVKVGEKLALPTDLDILFLSSLEPSLKKIELAEVEKFRKGLNHDKLLKCLIGEHRNPIWFEKLFMSWLFGGKYSGFPISLGIIGPPGTGKSTGILYPITIQIPEPYRFEIFDGNAATQKGLVPSFGKNGFEEGYILECERIAYVDEYLELLKRNKGNKSYSDVDESGLMRTLLEQRPCMARSGTTKSATVRATAKMLLTTNPVKGMKSLVEMAEKLNTPFLSRILWYQQTKAHVEYIEKNKTRVMLMSDEKKYPVCNPDIVRVFDFFNVRGLPVNEDKISGIVLRAAELVPEPLHDEVYMSRASHHVSCLVDGCAKYRYLINEKEILDIDDADYLLAEELWLTVISSWGEIDFTKIPARVRISYLTPQFLEVYEYIEKASGVKKEELHQNFGANAYYAIKKLESLDLIYLQETNDMYYPFWYGKGLENTVNKDNFEEEEFE